MEPLWLNSVEARAWRGYRRLLTLLETRIARDLANDSGLSVPDYTVLSNLSEVEDRRWRLGELAERMQWSQSRLSHHLSRMEGRGLVVREQAESDGRGAVVTLTEEGMATIEAAAPAHVASVRRHMIDLLTDDELRALGDIAETVVDHLLDTSDQREST